MTNESAPEQIQIKETPISYPFPEQRWGRILYGLFVTIMPILSFWATELIRPEWQDGKLSSHLILLLSPKASLYFFPLLAYSILSYWFLLYAPDRFSRSFVIQLGIYTGVVLAFQYCIIVLVYSLDSYIQIFFAVWLSSLIVPWIYRRVVAAWTASRVNSFLLVFAVVVVLVGSLLTRGSLLFLILIFLTAAAPFWSFLIAWRISIWLLRNHEAPLTLLSGSAVIGWGTVYILAWRYDIFKMFELYAALPKAQPNCYIATAAAQGHPSFVGSYTVLHADGKSMQVNGQLQRLKGAELALMAVHPRAHTLLRKIYDVVGKALARRMKNPFVADVAYLSLKPVEWSAIFILKKIVPEIESVSRRLYINQ